MRWQRGMVVCSTRVTARRALSLAVTHSDVDAFYLFSVCRPVHFHARLRRQARIQTRHRHRARPAAARPLGARATAQCLDRLEFRGTAVPGDAAEQLPLEAGTGAVRVCRPEGPRHRPHARSVRRHGGIGSGMCCVYFHPPFVVSASSSSRVREGYFYSPSLSLVLLNESRARVQAPHRRQVVTGEPSPPGRRRRSSRYGETSSRRASTRRVGLRESTTRNETKQVF